MKKLLLVRQSLYKPCGGPKDLAENGIEVVAVHNHMVHEEPRIVFLHYWGVGPANQLALGLRAALDRTGR